MARRAALLRQLVVVVAVAACAIAGPDLEARGLSGGVVGGHAAAATEDAPRPVAPPGSGSPLVGPAVALVIAAAAATVYGGGLVLPRLIDRRRRRGRWRSEG